MNIKNVIDEIFDILLKVVRSNRNMEKMLNDSYKNALIDYLSLVPEDKQKLLCNSYMTFKNILSCVDFNKLINIANKSNIPSFKIDSKKIVCEFIVEKLDSTNKQDKKFIEKLLEKLDNIFIIVDYIIKNPKEIAANANVFTTCSDDIF